MDQKDILAAIEEGTKTLKSDFAKAREEQGVAFDAKVEKIVEDLKEFTTKEEVETGLKAAKEELQGNFDQFAAKYKNSAEDKKSKSFKAAIMAGVKESIGDLRELTGSASKVIEMKDMGFEDFVGYEIFTRDVSNQVIPNLYESFHMRQILGAGSTQGDTVYYPKATGKTGDGPAPWDYDKTTVTDTVAKADFEMTFDNVSAPVKWIAGILRIPRQMLDDVSWLASYLGAAAPQELLAAEDEQLLNGDGVGNNLSGILANATAYSASGAYSGVESIVDAAWGQMALVNQNNPTDVILNPVDIVSIILNKASTSGEYNLPNGAVGIVNGQLSLAGLRVQKSNKITANTFLVGDFLRGANLVTRQAPQLRAYEQDRDNVQKNMITFRIEERIALPIFYDEAFVTGELVATT